MKKLKQDYFVSVVLDDELLLKIRAIQKKFRIRKISGLLRALVESAGKAKLKKSASWTKQVTFRVSSKAAGTMHAIALKSGRSASQIMRELIAQSGEILDEKTLTEIASRERGNVEKVEKISAKKAVPAKKTEKKSVPAKTRSRGKSKIEIRNSKLEKSKKSVPAKQKRVPAAKSAAKKSRSRKAK